MKGVLGPGAANNSSMGGCLITTVAFGVPTTVLMAILIGAFLIQGLVPGPQMLVPEAKGGHLALTFSFVWIVAISNIITVAVCLLFLNQLVKITYIRGSVIVPVILLLVYLGTFAEKNAFPDMILMLFFGVLGWIMQQLAWPRPPFILGLVLGGLAETRLFLSVNNYRFAWLLRPAVLVIMALAVAAILYPLLRTAWQNKKNKGTHTPTTGSSSSGKSKFRFSWASLFSLAVAVIFAWALWQSRNFPFSARYFPWVLGFPVFVFAVVQFILDLTGRGDKRDGQRKAETVGLPKDVVRRRTAGVFGWLFGWFVAIWLFGFTFGATLTTFVQLKIGEREKWPLSLGLTGMAWALLYFVFKGVLHLPFPKGQLFRWLGLPSIF